MYKQAFSPNGKFSWSAKRLMTPVLIGVIGLLASSGLAQEEARLGKSSPNVLLIMADDLGFSDLGCYGSEIKTPTLDSLAAGGLWFNQFYNTARCWPTRAALLTGFYAQQVARDVLPGGPKRGSRPSWAVLLPKRLQPLGYRSYHSGKWHIDGTPIAEGFDRSYWVKDQHRFFSPTITYLDDQRLPPVKRDTGYYATTAIGDHAVECLTEHFEKTPDSPFFHYLAFTAPHFPLHALEEDVAKYAGVYEQGWDEARKQRNRRQQKAGLLQASLSDLEADIGPPYHRPDDLAKLGNVEINREVSWNTLTEQQKNFQTMKMQLHAAMIDRMDQEIARVIEVLRERGALDNTVVFFLSDNGASAEIMIRGDGHDASKRLGGPDSHLCLGPGWSSASNTPFRRHKTWVHEGGISTPLIVHWPDGISSSGAITSQVGHVVDLAPTIVALAGGDWQQYPKQPLIPGQSLKPALEGSSSAERELWWLHEGNRAFRRGDWKIVAAKDQPWELYNLHEDRSEMRDLAHQNADLVAELSSQWQAVTTAMLRQRKVDLE